MDPEIKIKQPDSEDPDRRHSTACESMPDFTRLRYFHGQMLGHHDFQNEQDYFREKLKLLNRCLQGYGTVCGLKVVAVKPDREYDPPTNETGHSDNEQYAVKQHDKVEPSGGEASYEHDEHRSKPYWVEIECGLALDCEGNELVVRHPLRVDLWQLLSDVERKEIEASEDDRRKLYLSICYCVQAIDPVRPVLPDACNAVSECVYSKLRDSVKVKVSAQKPNPDHCSDNCCDKCQDRCLVLAAIVFEKGKPTVIRNDVRRWVTTYEPVTITGINWVHGAENYTVEEGATILQDQGLTIKFSRPILPETVTKGVVDVLVSEGGKGRHGGLYYIGGQITVSPDNRSIVFKDTSEEMLQNADRVMIIVRTDFILDKCCRPVDGNHSGGRVPLLPEFAENKPRLGMPTPAQLCIDPPRRYGAWTSGNGTPGGTFESWFYISTPPKPPRPPREPTRYETDD